MASLEGRERGEREGGRKGGGGERENVYLMKIIITVDMYASLSLTLSLSLSPHLVANVLT